MARLDDAIPTMRGALERAEGGEPFAFRDDVGTFPGILAALLAQTIEAKKVDRALSALADQGLDEPGPLAEADLDEVRSALAGLKPQPRAIATLQRVARWLIERRGGDLAALEDVPTESLREELCQLNGVGMATADAILLFGLGRATYPVDRASYRIFVRHGWLDSTADYDEAGSTLTRLAPEDAQGLATWAAWLERAGRVYCKVAAPRCESCPLRETLPESGPCE